MERKRKNGPSEPAEGRRRSGGGEATERIRQRIRAEPGVELSEEELRALADEGVDPEDLRRAVASDEEQEASVHDRDTPRDRLESLVFDEDEY